MYKYTGQRPVTGTCKYFKFVSPCKNVVPHSREKGQWYILINFLALAPKTCLPGPECQGTTFNWDVNSVQDMKA